MGNQHPWWRRLWSFLTETRFGSTTPLGCVVQMLLVGLMTTLIMWVLLSQF